MRFTCAAGTDRGVVRRVNEDSYGMLADRGLFVVADGVGGHAATSCCSLPMGSPGCSRMGICSGSWPRKADQGAGRID